MPTEDRQKTLRAHIDNGRNGLRPPRNVRRPAGPTTTSCWNRGSRSPGTRYSWRRGSPAPTGTAWPRPPTGRPSTPWSARLSRRPGAPANAAASVDAIFICYAGADDGDRQTLLTFALPVPVFAVPAAAKTISGWGHFDHVVDTTTFDGTSLWRASHPGAPLPG
ncbi:hypothetical protein DL768_011301 [Monosporascus sp. mg162]|nr:hypothetical protein DL768_011301 [Monosporascus sp. mg162]